VAFVGLTARLEGEEMNVYGKGFAGGDRTDIVLPGVQEELLETVARKTGKPMIVVLLNGSALAIDWAGQHAQAILESWYPGEVGGKAVAETLGGQNNPAGRLPITFYTGIDQLPPFDDYSMTNRTYRYYTGRPLFSFGDGLSYTSFAYSHLRLSRRRLPAGEPLTITGDITNTGSVAGDEVAEVYVRTPHTPISPALQLAGIDRIHLAAGETTHVEFMLDPRDISQVDSAGNRSVVPGRYRVFLGGSQPTGDEAAGVRSVDFFVKGRYALPK
jgi:beta-glucosidase